MDVDDDVPPTAGPIVTRGLFKKPKKRVGTAAANNTATPNDDNNTAAASSSSTATAPRVRASQLSFDDDAELAAEAAASGVDLVAMQLREERERRKKAKKLKQQTAAMAAAPSTSVDAGTAAAPAAASSAGLYTPDALAELRRNARQYSAAPLNNADTPASTKGVDAIDLDPEVNLAALPAGSSVSMSALDVNLSALPSGSFRLSGRQKQLALQEADDLRRMAAGGSSRSTAIVVADDDAGASSSQRDRELDRLAEERLIRTAKLKRERLRRMGADDAEDAANGYIPLSSSRALQVREGQGHQLSGVEFDRRYGVAVRGDMEDDEEEHASRLLREDPDGDMLNVYDDDTAGGGQGDVAADRLHFGDPLGGGPTRASKRDQIGALLSNSAAWTKKRGDSIRTALRANANAEAENALDEDDLEGGAELDDDETRSWEEEMMRKGGAKAGVAAAAAAAPSKATRASAIANTASTGALSLAEQVDSTLASASSARGTAASTIDPVDLLHHGLTSQLAAMRASQSSQNTRFHRLEAAIRAEHLTQHALKESLESKSSSYVFYQELTERLLTALDCLSEKQRDIDAAAEELREMRRTRRVEVDQCIDAHEADLLAECFGGGDNDDDVDVTPQVDEFGRDIGGARETEKSRRRETRLAWLQAQVDETIAARQQQARADAMPIKVQLASAHASSSFSSDPLGWRSFRSLATSSSELGSGRFDSAVSSLLDDTSHIFVDTGAEFRTLDGVKSWMEEWKRRERHTYEQAFIPTSMPVILAPYVKLELMQRWDLVRQPHFSEEMPTRLVRPNNSDEMTDAATPAAPKTEAGWYQKLFDYGMSSSPPPNADGSTPEDDDSHLLPTLVDRVLVPRVTEFIALEFDIFSSHAHVPALRSCIGEIEVHLVDPTTSVNLRTLRETLMTVCEQAITAHHSRFSGAPTAAGAGIDAQNQAAYTAYHFHAAVHLLHSVAQLATVLDPVAIKRLASQHLVQSILPPLAWHCAHADTYPTGMPSTGHGGGSPSSLLEASRRLALTPRDLACEMAHHLFRVFPREWLADSATSNGSANSMTQLHRLLEQMDQARRTNQTQQIGDAIKQIRLLLGK